MVHKEGRPLSKFNLDPLDVERLQMTEIGTFYDGKVEFEHTEFVERSK